MEFFLKLKKAFICGNLLRKIIKLPDQLLGLLVRKLVYRRNKIVGNRIFVMTFDNKYSCNQKYIVEEILRRKLPVEIIWTCGPRGIPQGFPSEVQLVNRGSYSMYEAQATSRIWLDNALNCVWFGMPKKKGQVYFNTWHGSLGIKRLGGNRRWFRRAARCDKLTDFCVTNSQFEEDVFRSTFWPHTPFLKFGHPRNDVFFHPEEMAARRREVFHFYRLPEDVRVFLYAPTFREEDMDSYEQPDYAALRDALEQRFGGRWVIMIRWHMKEVRKRMDDIPYDWIVNASSFANMQDLLPAVDAGMSDYSSWVFDYMLTGRPVFLYAPDLELYDQARGFYYPLDATPFPLARSSGELIDQVLAFDAETYDRDVKAFLDEKGCYEDGGAARRVVDKLEEYLDLSGTWTPHAGGNANAAVDPDAYPDEEDDE